MLRLVRLWAVLWVSFFLFACGGAGGDSTTTTIRGNGLNTLGQSPAVTTGAVQTDNNLLVSVQDGPSGFRLAPNANILYATVKVCHPVTLACVDIDKVQVDTGSVGLRVLASKVKSLKLPPLEISANPVVNAYECFPFVIGGLWGANAKAVVGLGLQKTGQVAIHLIEDDPVAALQAPSNCVAATANNVLSSSDALGSNGILGVGSTNLDCGSVCLDGSYAANMTFVQYYGCPQGAARTADCSTTAPVAANLQVSNPISAFANPAYNNGVVLAMPAVTDPGAAAASGELIFGVDSIAGSRVLSNNTVPSGARKVLLGVDTNNMAAYLNITTQLTLGGRVQTFASSYLDTGTNGLFFTDSSATPIARCANSSWYCPNSVMALSAALSDGGSYLLNPASVFSVNVVFQVGNAEALFSTSNTAFSDASGAAPTGSAAFAWGMPFFYGKRVYLSIWDITTFGSAGPWYAWTAL